MARERTDEEILDQLVYAVACVARHYGSGLSAEGLFNVRRKLAEDKWYCDTTWRVDVLEGLSEPNPDFYPSVLTEGMSGLCFEDVVLQSRTGEQ